MGSLLVIPKESDFYHHSDGGREDNVKDGEAITLYTMKLPQSQRGERL
jgi:hypothetical protein